MCFSATASFSAGAVLLGLGTLTLNGASPARTAVRRNPAVVRDPALTDHIQRWTNQDRRLGNLAAGFPS